MICRAKMLISYINESTIILQRYYKKISFTKMNEIKIVHIMINT
ncbi:MAG: hypothetical protein ACJAXF_001514 [Polaribacter sp.]|jgi:hypothetical protein